MQVKFECSPDAMTRFRCMHELFNKFGVTDALIEYIEESEHLEGPSYWADHYRVGKGIDYTALVKDAGTFMEDNKDVNQG